MGMYVYRVTPEKIVVNGITAQVAKYAYKPYYSDQYVNGKYTSASEINRKLAFKTGCMAKTKITTEHIVLCSDDRAEVALYANPSQYRVFEDDRSLGTDRMPLVGQFIMQNGKYVKDER